jgi:hypothetical protein
MAELALNFLVTGLTPNIGPMWSFGFTVWPDLQPRNLVKDSIYQSPTEQFLYVSQNNYMVELIPRHARESFRLSEFSSASNRLSINFEKKLSQDHRDPQKSNSPGEGC